MFSSLCRVTHHTGLQRVQSSMAASRYSFFRKVLQTRSRPGGLAYWMQRWDFLFSRGVDLNFFIVVRPELRSCEYEKYRKIPPPPPPRACILFRMFVAALTTFFRKVLQARSRPGGLAHWMQRWDFLFTAKGWWCKFLAFWFVIDWRGCHNEKYCKIFPPSPQLVFF